jgi:hypothetical protein
MTREPPDRDDDLDASAAERARAASLARLVDGFLAGRPAPPALEAEERELVETAALLRGALGAEVSTAAALALAPAPAPAPAPALEPAPAPAPVLAPAPAPAAGSASPDTRAASASITASATASVTAAAAPRRPTLRRAAPWALAAAAIAAALLLAVTRPGPAAAPLPAELRSRPADRLVGPIERRLAAAAARRADLVYADRLAGYRQLVLRPGARRP